MEKDEIMELIKQGEPITVGSEGHALLVEFSNEALRITAELNSKQPTRCQRGPESS